MKSLEAALGSSLEAMVVSPSPFAELFNNFTRSDLMIICLPFHEILNVPKNKAGLSPDLIREILEFTPPNPTARLQAITGGWSQLQYQGSEFLLGAGITVEREPLKIEGRLLPAPNVGFGGGQKIALDVRAAFILKFSRSDFLFLQRPGVWDIMNKRLLRPAQFPERWAVVNFSPCDMSVVGRFVDGLQEAMRNRGEYLITEKPKRELNGGSLLPQLLRHE